MGVTGIWEYLQRYMEKTDISSLKNKRIAVDGHGWLCDVVRSSVPDSSRARKLYLSTFYSRCRCLMVKGINPVVVFDGFDDTVHSSVEGSSYMRRKDRRRVMGSIESKQDWINKIEEIKVLLNTIGVRWMASKLEGAAQCAQLEKRGLVEGCITRDYDFILFGGKSLYQVEFSQEGSALSREVLHLSMDHIKDVLCIDRSALIAMSIMMGCDYYQKGIPGVGLVTALEITSEFYLMEHDHPQVILDRFKSYASESLPSRDYDSNVKQKLRASVLRNSVDLRGFNPNSDVISNTVNFYLIPTVIEYSRTQLPKKLMPNYAKAQEILLRECNWTYDRFANSASSNASVEGSAKKVAGKCKEEQMKCSKRERAALDRLRLTSSLYRLNPMNEVTLPSTSDEAGELEEGARGNRAIAQDHQRSLRKRTAADEAPPTRQAPSRKMARKDRSLATISASRNQPTNAVNGTSGLTAVGDQSGGNNVAAIDDVAHNALQVIQSTA